MLDPVKNISPVGGGHIYADDVAAVVAFLASDDAKVTLSVSSYKLLIPI